MKAFYCNPPRAKKSKYVHRIQKLLRDTVHHESVGKCDAPNTAGTGATDSGYRKKRSIFDELEEEFNQEIEAEAQPDVQSEDDGFVEKGNYGTGGAKPSATPNPKRKLGKLLSLTQKSFLIQLGIHYPSNFSFRNR